MALVTDALPALQYPYGHAPADGRNPARRALLDSQPVTDRPRTGLYQDTMA